MSTSEYQTLVEANLSFAERLARRFYREFRYAELDFDDVRSAAFTGLCMAAQRYQDSRGVPFQSYSYMRIRGAMLDLLRHHSNPFSNRSAVDEARHASDGFEEQGLDRQLSCFSQALARTIEELGLSFTATGSSELPELCYLSMSSPEAQTTANGLRQFVFAYLEQLPERERTLVKLRYYKDQSFPEMATELNDVRSSWLSRIHSRALDRLRTMIAESDAREWLQQVA